MNLLFREEYGTLIGKNYLSSEFILSVALDSLCHTLLIVEHFFF